MERKQVWSLLSLLGIIILFAIFPPVTAAFETVAQTIPTITPTPGGSQPTATSAGSNPTATSPGNPPPTSASNPTATSPTNPTATTAAIVVSATPSRTPRVTTTTGPSTPSATPERGTATATTTALPSLTPATTARATLATGSSGEENGGEDLQTATAAEEETVTELATASPIPGREDEITADETAPAEPLPDETEGGSLLWVFLLGVGLVIAAAVLFFTGRRAG